MGSMLGLASLGAAMTAAGHARHGADRHQGIVGRGRRGRQEGRAGRLVVLRRARRGDGASSREFEQLYGIRVELAPARTGDFEARWNAERAAGKPSIDVRSSGSPENRRLAARGLDQSFGTLPAAVEPGVPWIIDPLVDVKAGNGHTLHIERGRLLHPRQQQARARRRWARAATRISKIRNTRV